MLIVMGIFIKFKLIFMLVILGEIGRALVSKNAWYIIAGVNGGPNAGQDL